MGGGITGAELIDSIIHGKTLSKTVEVFLQTGKASETFDGANGIVCRIDCSGAMPMPRAAPEGRDGYTEEEAKAEASRCFLCDCEMCMNNCEMLEMYRKKPKKIAMEVYTDTKAVPPYSTHTITRQTFSCNMCGHCKAICPEDVDIGALMQLSRASRVVSGEYPEAFHDYWLREMDFSNREASYFAMPEGGAEHIFFPGCQLGAHNPAYVLKSYECLIKDYSTGILINCCGAPAYWAGDTQRQTANFEYIRSIWHESGKPKFVFACATCESIFDMFLPEISRISLYELLALQEDAIPVRRYDTTSVFDPCNARKNPDMESAVRVLAQRSGATLSELPEKNRCCGFGGHIRLANPGLYDKITENRADMGNDPYIVYCVNCREVFAARGKSSAHILDLVFDLPHDAAIPRINNKRENAMKVKETLNRELFGKDIEPITHEWDALELVIDEDIADSIDKKLIALSDLKEAIWLAEKTNDKFIDDTDGVCHCSLVKPVLTYWVQYKKTDSGAFEVYDAYYHRMSIREGEEA